MWPEPRCHGHSCMCGSRGWLMLNVTAWPLCAISMLPLFVVQISMLFNVENRWTINGSPRWQPGSHWKQHSRQQIVYVSKNFSSPPRFIKRKGLIYGKWCPQDGRLNFGLASCVPVSRGREVIHQMQRDRWHQIGVTFTNASAEEAQPSKSFSREAPSHDQIKIRKSVIESSCFQFHLENISVLLCNTSYIVNIWKVKSLIQSFARFM